MGKTVSITLNSDSIDAAIRDLEAYKDDLDRKMKLFVERLLEVGVQTAQEVPGIPGTYGSHHMEDYVVFYKEMEHTDNGFRGKVVAESSPIEATWFGSEGDVREGTISPVLALEFGTAALAVPAEEMFGGYGGQGTNSVYGHDGDLQWYFITDFEEIEKPDGTIETRPIWKKATAIHPTHPMLQASSEMLEQVRDIAREVFGT